MFFSSFHTNTLLTSLLFLYFSILLLLLIVGQTGNPDNDYRGTYICSQHCSFSLLLVKIDPTSMSPLEIPSDSEESAIESGTSALQVIQGLQQEWVLLSLLQVCLCVYMYVYVVEVEKIPRHNSKNLKTKKIGKLPSQWRNEFMYTHVHGHACYGRIMF